MIKKHHSPNGSPAARGKNTHAVVNPCTLTACMGAAGLAVLVSCFFLRQQREVADVDAIASRRDAYGDGISVCEYRNLCVNAR